MYGELELLLKTPIICIWEAFMTEKMDSLGKLKFSLLFYTKNWYSVHGLPKLSNRFYVPHTNTRRKNSVASTSLQHLLLVALRLQEWCYLVVAKVF